MKNYRVTKKRCNVEVVDGVGKIYPNEKGFGVVLICGVEATGYIETWSIYERLLQSSINENFGPRITFDEIMSIEDHPRIPTSITLGYAPAYVDIIVLTRN